MPADGNAARIVLSTAPDLGEAERLAGLLVGAGLAACVNLLPGIVSIYVWQGEAHRDAEVLMVIKTTAAVAADVIGLIEVEHPYDCPEAIVLEVAGGAASYLEWIAGSVD